MIPADVALNERDTEAVLAATVREVYGPGATLEHWIADPVTRHGRRRVVCYDLSVRAADAPDVQRVRWVGKFYERDDEARRVTATLRALAATGCAARGGFAVPAVVAYHAARRVLLCSYEAGGSVTTAIAQHGAPVLEAIGRALAALHRAPVAADTVTSPAAVLEQVRLKLADLMGRFPAEAGTLRRLLAALEREAPAAAGPASFLHGDFGPAQLLWRDGELVMLDFDRATRGDPALDLGNLLVQLRRFTLRHPDVLPPFAAVRLAILDAYQRWSPHDAGLVRRARWYGQAALVRKIHALTFDTTRRPEPQALVRRRTEAVRLLSGLR